MVKLHTKGKKSKRTHTHAIKAQKANEHSTCILLQHSFFFKKSERKTPPFEKFKQILQHMYVNKGNHVKRECMRQVRAGVI